MSRIGKLPVAVPAGVEIELVGQTLRAKGPQGELTLNVHPDMKVSVDGGEVRVLPLRKGVSTTRIIRRIVERLGR